MPDSETPERQPETTDYRVPAPGGEGSGGEGSGLALLRRFAVMPLARHVVVLAVVLFAALPLMHRGSMVSADEGAVLSQIWILEHRGGWGAENPAAAIDPWGEWFGIDIVESADGRYFPYAKHPLYPVLALGAFRVAGLPAVVALSTLGTLAAAVLTALLARRVRPGSDVVALWVAGLVSPLFFDGYWVIAHSLGAAGAALAVWSAIRWFEGSAAIRCWPPIVLGVVAAVMLRSEGALFAVALGVGGLVVAAATRRVSASAPAIVAVLAGGLAYVVDSRWHAAIVGGNGLKAFVIRDERSGWLAGRWSGAYATLLRPHLLAPTALGMTWFGIAIVTVVVAYLVRTRGAEVGRTVRWASLVVMIVAPATLLLRPAPVPGLLVAFPLLGAGLVLATGRWLRAPGPLALAVTGAAFVAAVLATQYAVGGSMEWGGRFFHLALPLLIPLVLDSLAEAGARLDARTARAGALGLAIPAMVLVVIAVGSTIRLQTVTADLVDTIHRVSESTVPGDTSAAGSTTGSPTPPVVVVNMEAVGRFSWRTVLETRHLRVVDSGDLARVADRLRRAGVTQFTFASAHDHTRDLGRLGGYSPAPGRTETVGVWRIYVMNAASTGG